MWEICLDILTAEGNLFQKVVDSHTKGFNKGAFMEAGQI